MKNIILFFFSTIILFSKCNQPKEDNSIHLKTEKHFKTKENAILNKKDITSNSNFENSPVKIIKATLAKSSYSDHKDIKILYKNSGKKAIKAIKLEWSCINAFEEPANGYYFYGEGNFKGNITNLIKPGQIKSEIWEDFSTDADKIIKIRAYYIVYTDGTKWKLKKDEDSL